MKRILSLLVCGAIVTSLWQSAFAYPISGQLVLEGTASAYLNSSATGAFTTNYAAAHSLDFNSAFVFSGTETFASIPQGEPVSMYSPLEVNPPSLPVPANSPIWEFNAGGVTYSLTLSSLTEPTVTETNMVLQGSGTVSDGIAADNSFGTWTMLFTNSSDGGWIGTFTVVSNTSPPLLSIQQTGSNVVISWPTNSSGMNFTLQQSTNLLITNWFAVTNIPVLVSNQMVVTNPISTGTAFFRLKF